MWEADNVAHYLGVTATSVFNVYQKVMNDTLSYEHKIYMLINFYLMKLNTSQLDTRSI